MDINLYMREHSVRAGLRRVEDALLAMGAGITARWPFHDEPDVATVDFAGLNDRHGWTDSCFLRPEARSAGDHAVIRVEVDHLLSPLEGDPDEQGGLADWMPFLRTTAAGILNACRPYYGTVFTGEAGMPSPCDVGEAGSWMFMTFYCARDVAGEMAAVIDAQPLYLGQVWVLDDGWLVDTTRVHGMWSEDPSDELADFFRLLLPLISLRSRG